MWQYHPRCSQERQWFPTHYKPVWTISYILQTLLITWFNITQYPYSTTVMKSITQDRLWTPKGQPKSHPIVCSQYLAVMISKMHAINTPELAQEGEIWSILCEFKFIPNVPYISAVVSYAMPGCNGSWYIEGRLTIELWGVYYEK